MSYAVLCMLEAIARDNGRDATLTYVRSHGSWRAQCGDTICQSQVSAEDALLQLDRARRKNKTDRLPVVS